MRLNLKRLALLSGRPARKFAEQAGLTPQRIDLMLLLREGHMNQKQLALRLCVCPAVVSKMLSALVELELVERITPSYDRRHREPILTALGLARLALCFPGSASHGAQDHGEITWLGYWSGFLAELGIVVDSILLSRAPSQFASFAAWASCYGTRHQWRHAPSSFAHGTRPVAAR